LSPKCRPCKSNNRVDHYRPSAYHWDVRTARQLHRRLSQVIVCVAALALPFGTAWPTSCGCGMSTHATAASHTSKSGDGACCHQHKSCCCQTAAKSARSCCKARNTTVASSGCRCGASCQCAQPQNSAPAAPSPNNGPSGKELSCQVAAAAVMPQAIEPACLSLHSRGLCWPTVVTPLERCSALGRFLL
jgi:hypothetical protein